MTAVTDVVGHGVDQQFVLRRLEQRAAEAAKTSNENTGR